MTTGSPSHGMPPRGSDWLDSFSVVGTGALARSLTRSLVQHGMTCHAILGRDQGAAAALGAAFNAGNTGEIGIIPLPACDVVFIVVSDDALEDVATRLAGDPVMDGQIILHTSGVHTAAVLDQLTRKGAHCGSFHPLQTFTGEEGKERFSGITIGVEGAPKAVEASGRLADDLLATAVVIPSERKALYHAAAVMAGNHAIAMLATASDLWERATSDPQGGRDALGPLTRQSVINALEIGPEAALTGPVVRGDLGTLRHHLQALKIHAEHLLPMYAAVVTETVHLAMRSGRLSTERAVEMLDVVASEMGMQKEGGD